MNQAREWKEVLTQAKKEGAFILERGERIRDYVAEILKEPREKIKQLQAIDNNAADCIKEEFAKGNLAMTAAYTASSLPKEKQDEIAAKAAAGEDVKCEEIRRKAAEKKEEEIKAEDVSDTDTDEEEKENARKLHVLKMLEK